MPAKYQDPCQIVAPWKSAVFRGFRENCRARGRRSDDFLGNALRVHKI
jgi:hypothetical protein